MDDKLKQPYQGQLIKFTNVVKGWQSRWFILDPEIGSLEYYLSEGDKYEKARGSIQLAGAVISPSDEDSLTFTVSPAVGESYKLRAQDTKDRQMWINRLRIIAEMHTRAIAHHHPPLAPREHRSRENTSSHQHLPRFGGGLDVIDAFTQVAEILEESQRQHAALAQSIEELPSHGLGLRCTEPNILLIKATSQATLLCLDQCLSALRSRHSALQHSTSHNQSHHVSSGHQSKPQGGSPQKSGSLKSVTAPQSPALPLLPPSTPLKANRTSSSPIPAPERSPSSLEKGLTSSSNFENLQQKPLLSSSTSDIAKNESSENNTEIYTSSKELDSDLSDSDDNIKTSEDGRETPVEEGQRSVIMHIISQLRLGMDLTRVTLPTFILEKRSLLEMFADFLGHPDYFLKISTCETPEERIMAVAKWYLTSIHVGRQGSIAKKPYNPIIGEAFHCSWKVPAAALSGNEAASDESSGSKYFTIKYSSEQVSHHPPVSAFYIECPEKEMCINAHIWTKSKFMGMSVGVNLIGSISLFLGKYSEAYYLAMPSAYARSVLMEPWVELGGRVNIYCPQSGYAAPIVFHTRPFYGGRLHKVTCEVKNPIGNVLCRIQGEWDSSLELSYENGKTEVINIKEIDLVSRKRVRPIEKQEANESRRLWVDVTKSLSRGQLETATNHKKALEDKQRAEEQMRKENNTSFPTKLFYTNSSDQWIFKDLPKYARNLSNNNSCSSSNTSNSSSCNNSGYASSQNCSN